MEHTPGPWHIPKDMTYTIRQVNNDNVTICSAKNSQYVKAGEAQANACLIAAAPDLLEACKRMLRQYKIVDPQYIKYAQGWLNGERWEDDMNSYKRKDSKPKLNFINSTN